jgi:flagellar motor protein MotB
MIDEESSGSGTPAWVVTFADLMSLLMCFFVLLLSFSEIDAQKFRQIAGELSQAFGVQRDVPVEDVPTGSSIAFSELLAESGSAMAALERTDAERLTSSGRDRSSLTKGRAGSCCASRSRDRSRRDRHR